MLCSISDKQTTKLKSVTILLLRYICLMRNMHNFRHVEQVYPWNTIGNVFVLASIGEKFLIKYKIRNKIHEYWKHNRLRFILSQ